MGKTLFTVILFFFNITDATGLAVFDLTNAGYILQVVDNIKVEIEHINNVNANLKKLSNQIGSSFKEETTIPSLINFTKDNYPLYNFKNLDKSVLNIFDSKKISELQMVSSIEQMFFNSSSANYDNKLVDSIARKRRDFSEIVLKTSISLINSQKKSNIDRTSILKELHHKKSNISNLNENILCSNSILLEILHEIQITKEILCKALEVLASSKLEENTKNLSVKFKD